MDEQTRRELERWAARTREARGREAATGASALEQMLARQSAFGSRPQSAGPLGGGDEMPSLGPGSTMALSSRSLPANVADLEAIRLLAGRRDRLFHGGALEGAVELPSLPSVADAAYLEQLRAAQRRQAVLEQHRQALAGHLASTASFPSTQQRFDQAVVPMHGLPSVAQPVQMLDVLRKRPPPSDVPPPDEETKMPARKSARTLADQSSIIISSLSRKERRANFPLPLTTGDGHVRQAGAMASFRRSWDRLEEKAAQNTKLDDVAKEEYVRDNFAASLQVRNYDRMYRKVHGLSSLDNR